MVTKATVFLPAQTLQLTPGAQIEGGKVIKKIVQSEGGLDVMFEGGGMYFSGVPFITDYTEDSVKAEVVR